MAANAETRAAFTDLFDFDFDPFQQEAMDALDNGHGVLVCAPTGSGKTIVGEYAIHLALSKGARCYYTTPIKALSNQKYHDLVARYGEQRVGLLTGDRSINPDGDVVVMTTEVLRNMIYAEAPQLVDLSHVVMDEIHYLADRSRGSVWEEVILNVSEYTTIVGLSATVSNAEEFGRWLETVRGAFTTVISEHRPVPLNQWMLVGHTLHPLLNTNDGGVNPNLHRAIDRTSRALQHEHDNTPPHQRRKQLRQRRVDVIRTLQTQDLLPAIYFIFSRVGCDDAAYHLRTSKLTLTSEYEQAAIARIVDAGVADIDEQELRILNFAAFRTGCIRGFAAHHAGMLPAFRHIVEDLFAQGLLKVVFATETLALGINMPARTVILERLIKYDGEAHVPLTPGQYTQLTGRAGRRGIDVQGHAVIVWEPQLDVDSVAQLASTRTYPLNSTFTPGYNMAVNLINTIGFAHTTALLNKSFAQFQIDGKVVHDYATIDRAKANLARLKAEFEEQMSLVELPVALQRAVAKTTPAAAFLAYMRLRYELSQREKKVKQQRKNHVERLVVAAIGKLQPGAVIAYKGRRAIHTAVVIRPGSKNGSLTPEIINEEGWQGRMPHTMLSVAPVTLGTMQLPNLKKPPRRVREDVVRYLHRANLTKPRRLSAPRITPDSKSVRLRRRIEHHVGHSFPDRERLARLAEAVLKAERTLDHLQRAMNNQGDSLVSQFTRIVELLTRLDYLEQVPDTASADKTTMTEQPAAETAGKDNLQPESTVAVKYQLHSVNDENAEQQETAPPVYQLTAAGTMLSHLHSEADLLLAQCIRRGVFADLDPAEIAGVLSILCFQNRRDTPGKLLAPTDPIRLAAAKLQRIFEELQWEEADNAIPPSKVPDPGFVGAAHQWTAGAPLEYALAAAQASGIELAPGDFVRWCRQLLDLMNQVANATPDADLAAKTRLAINAIRRGVVAIGL
ncbi:DEAD/DEAH box helicase [Corynebacterium choanae]|nr:DEAD/DEAH box helicase [Corynebacterium choanae]